MAILKPILTFIVFICILFPLHLAAQQVETNRIALVFDGPWPSNDKIAELYRDEIQKLSGSNYDAAILDQDILVGNWQNESISEIVDKTLADPDIRLVITTGIISADYLAGQTSFPKPVISTFMLEPQLQYLPKPGGKTEVPNFNYLTTPPTLERDIEQFLELVPFTKLGILVGSPFLPVLSGLNEAVQAIARKYQLEILLFEVGNSSGTVLADLTDVEAVYLGPTIHLSRDEHDKLITGINERGIPSFSYLGEQEVREGVYATLNPDIFPRLARRVGLHVQRILMGDEPSQLNTIFAAGERLFINLETARSIGVYPPLELTLEAELINEHPAAFGQRYSVESAIEEGLRVNLTLASKQVSVDAEANSINLARSNLLPQLDLSGVSVLIDEDRAEASFGMQAQRTLTGSATLKQVIYSEPAMANINIQRSLQRGREYNMETARLDITQQVALAYLNVLRTKTLQNIQRENLRLTRSYLELAKVRESIGQSGPGEVYRLQSQLATNRKNLVEARANQRSAEVVFNQILNRPQEERFETTESDIDPDFFTFGRQAVTDLIRTEYQFRRLRDFMVEMGLESSPEIETLASFKAAKDRQYQSARNAFFLPTIALQAQGSHILAEGGAGTNGPGINLPSNIITQFPGVENAFPEADETFWNIGLNFRFPIFMGGSRTAERQKSGLELKQLDIEMEQTYQLIEQNIRTRLHAAGASFAGINQSKRAAEAAEQNLNLVSDAYSQGVISIVELLEAQNAALVSKELQTNAKYDFFSDLMKVQRAIGQFEFSWTAEERQDFLNRLEEYMSEHSEQN